MKLLHKLLVVALFGAMVVPGLEAPRTKGAGQKHGYAKGKGAWKDMTPEQRAERRAKAKANRDAMTPEEKAAAKAKRAAKRAEKKAKEEAGS